MTLGNSETSAAKPPIRWRTGKCEKDKRPHLENEYHICHNWRKFEEVTDAKP